MPAQLVADGRYHPGRRRHFCRSSRPAGSWIDGIKLPFAGGKFYFDGERISHGEGVGEIGRGDAEIGHFKGEGGCALDVSPGEYGRYVKCHAVGHITHGQVTGKLESDFFALGDCCPANRRLKWP